MRKCKYCNQKFWNNRRYKNHVKECKNGQSKAGATERQATKKELAGEPEGKEVKTEKGYSEMTVHELRIKARNKGIVGLWSMSKVELIEALEEGD